MDVEGRDQKHQPPSFWHILAPGGCSVQTCWMHDLAQSSDSINLVLSWTGVFISVIWLGYQESCYYFLCLEDVGAVVGIAWGRRAPGEIDLLILPLPHTNWSLSFWWLMGCRGCSMFPFAKDWSRLAFCFYHSLLLWVVLSSPHYRRESRA